jgi:hypothetical protein
LLRARVEVRHLREVPRALQVHDVVEHLHVGVEDLAAARVHGARPDGVLARDGSQRTIDTFGVLAAAPADRVARHLAATMPA